MLSAYLVSPRVPAGLLQALVGRGVPSRTRLLEAATLIADLQRQLALVQGELITLHEENKRLHAENVFLIEQAAGEDV